jgi:hypothetical protein
MVALMRPNQLQLFAQPENARGRREHGGDVRRGKRKIARPLSTRQPLHLVLRSSQATGSRSFLKHKGVIHLLLKDTAERYGIKVFRYENVGNHLHVVIQGKRRAFLRAFLRVFPQRVMFAVTGARKGNPQGRFFDRIIYSRVVTWGREFETLMRYMGKNLLEALGLNPERFVPL